MTPIQNLIFRPAIPPAAQADNTAPASNVIDINDGGGAAYLIFILTLGATDVALAELKVNESDARTDDTTLDAGTEVVDWSATKTLPGATDDDKVFAVVVDLRKSRKRYQQLALTAGNGASGTFVSAVAFFSNVGKSDAAMGCADLLAA
ncbi:MAG: hypothetical protein AAF823_16165 [Planctomycetota bacterium]